MEESVKNRIILILVILTVIFFMGSIGSCSNAHRYRVARDNEMVTRIELEENMNKLMQEKTIIEGKLNNLTKELEQEKTAYEETKKALLQEQLVNQSLKEELQKITKLKDTLEEALKEALVNTKSGRTK